MFRKILFWSHLVCGVTAGLVIFMMSLTGVLLAFERQIVSWAEARDYVPEQEQSQRLPLEQLQFMAASYGGMSPSTITLLNNPGAPVVFAEGRRSVSVNPYTGARMEVGSPALENFFSINTGLHRWFNLSGESRDTARMITGASNLMFLFILVSGLYLWFPRLWKWGMFKVRLLFRGTAGNARARDFNWHHVLGIWSALPLVCIVATASVFYYPWANNLVYQVYGEETPVRGGPPQTTPGGDDVLGSLPLEEQAFLGTDAMFASAARYIESEVGSWRQLSMSLPNPGSPFATFAVDRGNGGQPQHRHNLVLDRTTGAVTAWQPFSSQSPGRRTRSIIRFLHTGEVLGIWGQVVAGLVSFTSLFMVWTGLALAWRRLASPMLRNAPTRVV